MAQMELTPIAPIDQSVVPHMNQLTADGRSYGRRISLTPEVLYAHAQGFLTRCATKHFPKYGPNGTHPDAEKYSAWQACAAHVQALYARSADSAVKEELEQFILDASRGRSGSDMAEWIRRKERGEWSYHSRDPMLLKPGKERTEATAREFAKEIGVEGELAAIWGLRQRLTEIPVRQKAWKEERKKRGLSTNFISPWEHERFDPFIEFEKWQFGVTNVRDSATVCGFMLVACLIAAFIDPEELRKTFAKNRAAIFDLQKVRVDAIHLLKEIAQAGEEEFYQKDNNETVKWLREWATTEGRYTYNLVFDETPEETEEAIEKEKEEWEGIAQAMKDLREKWAKEEAEDEEMRKQGIVPPRDIEAQEEADWWNDELLPCPEPGQYHELVDTHLGSAFLNVF
jgi:hypothetical protein